MSNAIVVDKNYKEKEQIALPESFSEINPHNFYLFAKSYMAAIRENSAQTKTRAMVSGGGKKPWMQKGTGRARAGSMTSPVMVGGGKAHGAQNNRNYNLKVNKKQVKLAYKYALEQKAQNGKLFVVDSIKVESGKTKDAYEIYKAFGQKDILFITEQYDEKTFLSFRNLKESYLADIQEVNPYLVGVFAAVVIEKTLFEKITKEG
jgi:large subunit ribosomal protein L4